MDNFQQYRLQILLKYHRQQKKQAVFVKHKLLPKTAVFFISVTVVFDLDLDTCTTRCTSMKCAFIPYMSLITKLVQE